MCVQRAFEGKPPIPDVFSTSVSVGLNKNNSFNSSFEATQRYLENTKNKRQTEKNFKNSRQAIDGQSGYILKN